MKRDIQNIEDDISKIKRHIRRMLVADEDIIESLHNHELGLDADPDDYLNTNIFGYIRIPGVQDVVRNFICFSVDDIEDHRDNSVMKIQHVQFVVFCHAADIKTNYDIERHDLIGYLIREIFHNSLIFGMTAKLIYNKEGVTDNDYSTRTLKFELTRPNSLVRAKMQNKFGY